MENAAQNNELCEGRDKIFNFRPIAFAAVCLCLGIFLGYACSVYHFSHGWLLIGVLIFGAPFFFVSTKAQVRHAWKRGVLLLLAFLLGACGFILQIRAYLRTSAYEHTPVSVVGRVCATTETEYGFCVLLDEITVEENSEKGKLVAYLPATFAEIVDDGNYILLTGELTTKTQLFSEFGFNATRIGDDLRYQMDVEDCVVVKTPFSLFSWMRTRIKDSVLSCMDQTSASVTLAVLLGDTSFMDEGLLENMRRGGIAHVFAVSGLHVGVVFAITATLAGKIPFCKKHKLARLSLVAGLLLFYGGVCGFSASVVRAIVMCLCVYAANLAGFGKDFFETLGTAAILVLLLSPVALFEIGFMLSFSACLGIGLLTKPIEKALFWCCERVKELFIGKKLVELPPAERHSRPLSVGERIKGACVSYLAMSMAAQIATAPISLWAFSYLSLWTGILNALFVPIVVAGFSVLLLLALLGAFLPTAVGTVILYAPCVAWSFLLLLFQTVDFSAFALTGISVGYEGMACYYFALAFGSDKFQLRRREKVCFALLCLLVFAITVYAASV